MTTEIREQNARIKSVSLGWWDDGIGGMLTAWIHLDYGGGGQGFGGYHLGGPACAAFIEGVLEALEAIAWEKLPGISCRVRNEHSKVHAIGHFLKDKWFNPKETFENLRENIPETESDKP